MDFRRVTRSALYRSAAFFALSAAMVTAASAQSVPQAPSTAADGTEISDIVVTAQRRTERLQDVPVSVTVVSGAALEQGNIRSLTDLANRQPNLQITQAPGGDQLAVRGTGSGTNSGFEQSVGTFVDGLYRNRARATRVALFDVDRVEVLKGPQTTFFGANAIAGALNITTRKPTSTLQGYATALYAVEDGEYNVEGGVGGPLASGLNLRLSGRVNGMDGYIDNNKLGGKGPRARDVQGRVSVNAKPTSALTIDARFDYARLRDKQTFNGEIISCPPRTGVAGGNCAASLAQRGGTIDDRLDYNSDATNTFSNIDLYEGEVTANLDLGGASLISTTGYFKQKFKAQNDLTPFPGNNAIGNTNNYGVVGENFDQFSQELRIQSDDSQPLQYLVGAYYETSKLDIFTTSGGQTRIPTLGSRPTLIAVGFNSQSPVGYLRTSRQDSRTLSTFGSLKLRVTEALNITGSLRYSDIKKKTTNINVIYGLLEPGNGALLPGTAAQQAALVPVFAIPTVYPYNKRTDNGFMPSANVQYKITPDVMTYASFARGFKAGGFSGPSNAVFEPEHVNTYEAGFKAQFFGRRLQVNAAAFRSDYSNLQETQFVVLPGTVTSTSIVTNAAKSRAQGVELSVIARPTRRLTLSLDLARLSSRYQRYPNAPCFAGQTAAQGCQPATSASGQGQTLDGRARPFSPRWSGNVDVSYAAPLSDTLDLTFGATMYFKSSYLLTPSLNPASRQSAYAKVDLRLMLAGSRSDSWQVGVIAKNVLNKKTLAFFDDVPVNTGTYVALRDRPRSTALTASYRF